MGELSAKAWINTIRKYEGVEEKSDMVRHLLDAACQKADDEDLVKLYDLGESAYRGSGLTCQQELCRKFS